MTIRSVIRYYAADSQEIYVYIDNHDLTLSYEDHSILSGKPGIGARQTPTGNSIKKVELGALDRTAPAQIDSDSVGSSSFPTSVDLQWQPVADDTNGIGVWRYEVVRGTSQWDILDPVFTEQALTPATSYTYELRAVDYHRNTSTLSVNVTTAPAGAINPRRIGVRSTGSHWGGGGEQIDTMSGNLNFTVPLVTAMGRGGWSVPFALSYNSQLWRKDPGGTWKLGRDVGYGFGWRLMAGSITPYWSGDDTIHHYVFTDATGAE
jgi:hypothetical protein